MGKNKTGHGILKYEILMINNVNNNGSKLTVILLNNPRLIPISTLKLTNLSKTRWAELDIYHNLCAKDRTILLSTDLTFDINKTHN